MSVIKIHEELDKILSYKGGLVRGHLYEFYGPEGEGKTTLAILFMASAQRQGVKVGYVENEYLDKEHAEFFGVNTPGIDEEGNWEESEEDEADIRRAITGEEALTYVMDMCRKKYGLVILDSVAGLIPEADLEEDGVSSGGQYGKVAGLLARNLGKIRELAKLNNTAIIFINQIRAKINTGFGNFGPSTQSFGGYALKHFTSARFEIRKIAWIKYAGDVIGFKLRVRAPKKNRLAVPNRDAVLEIICDHDAPPLDEINKRKRTKIEAITFGEYDV